MSLLTKLKAVITKEKPAQQSDHRIRVRAIKNVPNLRMVQGQTYRVDPGTAAQLKVMGWADLIDTIPGLERAEAQTKDMNDRRQVLGQVLADNQKIVDADFRGRVPHKEAERG